MKINNYQVEKVQQIYQQNKEKRLNKKENLRQDSMEISGKAREIQQLEAKLKEIPEIRQEKVNKLKEAIAKGDYYINSKLIVQKIIEQLDSE